jgi:hypothetical protein
MAQGSAKKKNAAKSALAKANSGKVIKTTRDGKGSTRDVANPNSKVKSKFITYSNSHSNSHSKSKAKRAGPMHKAPESSRHCEDVDFERAENSLREREAAKKAAEKAAKLRPQMKAGQVAANTANAVKAMLFHQTLGVDKRTEGEKMDGMMAEVGVLTVGAGVQQPRSQLSHLQQNYGFMGVPGTEVALDEAPVEKKKKKKKKDATVNSFGALYDSSDDDGGGDDDEPPPPSIFNFAPAALREPTSNVTAADDYSDDDDL